jgi:small subunit ribosomal protein S9
MSTIKLQDLKDIAISSKKLKTASAAVENTKKSSQRDAQNRSSATGRRKTSVSRVWVKSGKGNILVNAKPISQYFAKESLQKLALEALKVCNCLGTMDVFCTVKGGGLSGQAGSIRHGIARALDKFAPEWHSLLRSSGLLTRDSRMVERKKYGQHKARKKTQFSKR